ncbi:MAG: hypothetical protein IPM27_01045 [Nitrosomonadales bacterium]|nr:hypothetical protein [Nitrosomonadales bacterium]
MNKDWLQIAKDFIVPLVVAFLPFAPSIYSKLTEPTLHFVYEVKNERNPVNEWNRQLSHLFKQIDSPDQKISDSLPAPLLKKIGSEVYKALPAMLSGIGYHPTDNSKVTILNVGDQELRNIRVYFTGCEGFDTYETWPDSLGSASNPPLNGPRSTGQVTLRYDKLSPSVNHASSMAQISFYGESTSNCVPTVEAELADGKIAVGKKTPAQEYLNEAAWDSYNKEKRVDFFFKLFLSFAVLYLFIQVRSVKKARQP